MATTHRDSFLVIGGSGFLGRHIVNALVARGDPVAVFDIVQRYHDTPFYSGDISDQAQVSDALRKVPSLPYPLLPPFLNIPSLRVAQRVSFILPHRPLASKTRPFTGR